MINRLYADNRDKWIGFDYSYEQNAEAMRLLWLLNKVGVIITRKAALEMICCDGLTAFEAKEKVCARFEHLCDCECHYVDGIMHFDACCHYCKQCRQFIKFQHVDSHPCKE